MGKSIFFRLLDSPVDSKGTDLLQQIALQNRGEQPDKTFPANPDAFGSIPGSPFAYWVEDRISELFKKFPAFLSEGRDARIGLSTRSDIRFLRLFWEVPEKSIGSIWIPYAKGGAYSPYFYDVHLVVDWENDGERVKTFISQGEVHSLETGDWSRWVRSRDKYFRPGITWPRRTQKGLNIRALPAGCIFADKGPVAFAPNDDAGYLLALLSLTNSFPFKELVRLQMVFGSYEVGVIQQTPVPTFSAEAEEELANLAKKCHDLNRIPSTFDETSHVFHLPALISSIGVNLTERTQATAEQEASRQSQISTLQARIDTRVAELYGIEDEGRKMEFEEDSSSILDPSLSEEDKQQNPDDEDEEESDSNLRPSALVSDLLMWCLGVAFGRWDMRFALKPELLPELTGPFAPLPYCSPSMLLSPDRLPAKPGKIVSESWLRARPNVLTLPERVDGPEAVADQEYPLPIAWDGILVDDPDHPRDIVTAVRRLLRLIWKEQADAIEQEACQLLEVPNLRTYFRDPRLFFNFHIKRYSKSRRKAPIYWLLQSAKRNYGVWLYYPRLNPDILFTTGREYVDVKLNLETSRLKELQTNLTGLIGTNLKMRERQVSHQKDLIEELKAFGKEMDRVALLELKPDLNDGVLLNVAPLYNLVPWKEAEKVWKELISGKYDWSSISQQLRKKGWVKN